MVHFMIDQTLRIPKKRLLEPVAKRFSGVKPETITLIALLVGLLAALMAGLGLSYWAFGLWLLNRMLDGLDGELARYQQTQSDFGGYLDIMGDLIVYAALPVALVSANPSSLAWLSLTVLLAVFYVNAGSWMYLAAILEKRAAGAMQRGEQTSITMPAGIIEGAETIVFYSLFLVFPAHTTLLFGLMSALIVITILQRIFWAMTHLKEPSA